MPRRIDIELTSSRDDGTWTWRAVGAREPRGTIAASLLAAGAKVGDELRVDAEFFVDGIAITGVVPSKGARQEPERLELLVAAKDEPLVTTTLAERTRDERGPRRDGGRREGGRREGPRRDGEGRGGEGRGGDRPPRGDRPDRPERKDRPPRRTRPEPPPVPVVERPKAKRLRPGKAHRNALLASLPEEQRPIAEQVVLGGLPAVRQAIEKQNAERTAAGETPIAAGPLLELAEELVPKVRTAEWRDRAEAAQRDLDVLDLRDLRSVVSTADAEAKDEETRAMAQVLREGLATRADAEHAAWLAELTATVEVGRIVRALRLSSRPPKAGSPLPADLATKLIDGAGAALTDDAPAERWVAVLDALAFAPVRDKVIPTSLPKELHADVQSTIARLATRIPKIAHIFEITPDRNAPRPKIERRRPKKQPPKPPLPKDGAKDPQDKGRGKGRKDKARTPAEDTTPAGGAQEAVQAGTTPAAEAPAAAPTTDAPMPIAAADPVPESTEVEATAVEPTPEPTAAEASPVEPISPPESAVAEAVPAEPTSEPPAAEAPSVEPAPEPAAAEASSVEPISPPEPAEADASPSPDEPSPQPNTPPEPAQPNPNPAAGVTPNEPAAGTDAAPTDAPQSDPAPSPPESADAPEPNAEA